MNYILPFLLSFLLGFFLINLLFLREKKKLNFFLHISLAIGLGLGLSSYITFYNFVLLGQLNKTFVFITNTTLLIVIILSTYRISKASERPFLDIQYPNRQEFFSFGILILTLVPIIISAKLKPYGGWDAWCIWNLKAKFLLSAGNLWENMFSQLLWYTHPHYPLLLPLMNVWGRILLPEPGYIIPFTTAVIFTFFTAVLLFSGLKIFTKNLPAMLAALLMSTVHYLVYMNTSQYCDIILAYFLLGASLCLIIATLRNQAPCVLLSGLFLGFLSFTKSEGTVAAAIFLAIAIPYIIFVLKSKNLAYKKLLKYFLIGVFVAGLPTIIFNLAYAPNDKTFINGFLSQSYPTSLLRLKAIIISFINHLVSAKWGGLWIVILVGLFLSKVKCFSREVIILPLFLVIYILAICGYYFINTYWEIGWWTLSSLNRILSGILPTALLWMFISLYKTEREH